MESPVRVGPSRAGPQRVETGKKKPLFKCVDGGGGAMGVACLQLDM